MRSWKQKKEIPNFSHNLWGGRLGMVEGEEGTQEWGPVPWQEAWAKKAGQLV